VPVYSAECCPAIIRGGLVMAWQSAYHAPSNGPC
jgi:hypothetical protein